MRRVLLIDDDAKALALLASLLEREGYRVQKAENGRKAIALFREDPAEVVVTDIFMPDQEGLETILALRRLAPSVRIVACSSVGGALGDDALRAALDFGADRALPKPLRVSELRQLLEEFEKP
jgi:CheY-like chemotaxis protein